MSNLTLASRGRTGLVMRVLPHGTVMIWEPSTKRAYPFYKAGLEVFHAMEEVRFLTDETDTIIVELARAGGSGSGKALHDYVTDHRAAQAAR